MATMASCFYVLLLCSTVAFCAYGEWENIPGRAIDITASVNYLWGLDNNNGTWNCARPCNGQWAYHSGARLRQIDADDHEVWGVTKTNAIYKRPIDASGNWAVVPGSLKHVSASGNGYIWGVNSSNSVFKCKKPCSGSWVFVDGHLKQIDGGYAYVYGIDRLDCIYRRPVDGSGSWKQIPGTLRHVTGSGKSEIFGTNAHGQVYRCRKPCIGDWVKVEGNLKKCDATFDSLVGVTTSDVMYRRHTGI